MNDPQGPVGGASTPCISADCGKAVKPGARFCPHCGAAQFSDPAAAPASLPFTGRASAGARTGPSPQALAIGGAGLLLAVLLFGFFVWPKVGGRNAGAEATNSTYYVTRAVKVRERAADSAPSIVTLSRGAPVSGRLVLGEDGETYFLQITSGPNQGRYAWSRNLSTTPRPELVPGGRQGPAHAIAPTVVYAEPRFVSKIDDLKNGDTVEVVGTTGDGWTEIALRRGGVGYVLASALSVGPSPAAANPVSRAELVGDYIEPERYDSCTGTDMFERFNADGTYEDHNSEEVESGTWVLNGSSLLIRVTEYSYMELGAGDRPEVQRRDESYRATVHRNASNLIAVVRSNGAVSVRCPGG